MLCKWVNFAYNLIGNSFVLPLIYWLLYPPLYLDQKKSGDACGRTVLTSYIGHRSGMRTQRYEYVNMCLCSWICPFAMQCLLGLSHRGPIYTPNRPWVERTTLTQWLPNRPERKINKIAHFRHVTHFTFFPLWIYLRGALNYSRQMNMSHRNMP